MEEHSETMASGGAQIMFSLEALRHQRSHQPNKAQSPHYEESQRNHGRRSKLLSQLSKSVLGLPHTHGPWGTPIPG